jgi:hypothetical protein
MSRSAFTSGELTTLRKQPQVNKLYLAVHVPGTVLACQLNGAPGAYPLGALAFDSVSQGSYSDVEAGMTLLVGSSAGARDKGWLRVRKAATSSTLYVAEVGRYAIDFADDDHLTVVDDRRIAPKFPRVFGESGVPQFMDYDVAYSGQNENFGPQAIVGPPLVGFLPDGSFVGNFVGERAVAHTPGSALASFLWTMPDATTYASQGTTASPVQHTFTSAIPNGGYFSFEVTDDNGDVHTGHRLAFVFERTGSNAPHEVVAIDSLRSRLGFGVDEFRVRVFEGVGESAFPRGAQVVIFAENWYGEGGSKEGAEIGLNYPYRANVLFAGWIVSEVTVLEPRHGEVEFSVASTTSLLGLMEGYPVALNRVSGSPGNWRELKGLTLDLAALHFCRWRSTLLDVVDVHLAGSCAAGQTIEYQDLDAASLYDQLRQNYHERGMLAHVHSDLQGALYCELDEMILATGDRVGATLWEMADGDRAGRAELPSPHTKPNAQVTLFGVDGETPLGARTPDDPKWYEGATEIPNPVGLAIPTAQIVNWASNLRAKLNNEYRDIHIPLSGFWPVDPVPQSYLAIGAGGLDTNRGALLAGTDLLIREVEIAFHRDAGRTLVGLICDAETVGIGAAGIDMQTEGDLPGYDWEDAYLPWDPWDFLPPNDLFGALPPGPASQQNPLSGVGKLALFADTAVYLTTNWNGSPPTWTRTALNSLANPDSLSGTIYQFVVDPFSPGNPGHPNYSAGGSIDGWIVTYYGIYKIENVFGSPTLVRQYTFPSWARDTWNWAQAIDASFGIEGWVVCTGYYGHVDTAKRGVWATYTVDGENWATLYQVTTHHNCGTCVPWFNFPPGCFVSPRTAGLVYTSAHYQSSSGGNRELANADLYKSTAYGAGFARVTGNPVLTPDDGLCGDIHVPYHDNENEMRMYGGWIDFPSSGVTPITNRLYRTNADGSVATDISPSYGGETYGVYWPRWSVVTAPLNRQRVALAGHRLGYSGGSTLYYSGLWTSVDAGDNWTLRVAPTATGSRPRRVAIAGDDPDHLFIFGPAGCIRESGDFGATIVDKAGNIPVDWPSAGTVVGLCGG